MCTYLVQMLFLLIRYKPTHFSDGIRPGMTGRPFGQPGRPGSYNRGFPDLLRVPIGEQSFHLVKRPEVFSVWAFVWRIAVTWLRKN